MADNMDAAGQRESPQAAKRMRLDTDHGDGASAPLSSLDAEVFVDSNHPNKVLEGLNRLRLNTTLCDVTLCCEGQEVPCHRYVLASFSPYFEAMFTSGMVESTQERVTMKGVEPHVIGLLVNYAYTSKVSISTDNVQDLLVASDLLEVPAVREACSDYMVRHLDINNCVEIYCFADDHSCEMLKEHSKDYILEHFSVVYQQEEFLSLSVERLIEVLSSDHLNVPKEDMVLEAALLWLDRCPSRKHNFEKVLEQICLPLISPSYLLTVVESLDVVKDHQGCQRFISEAKGERPYSNTAHPRYTTEVIVTVGQTKTPKGFDKVESFDPLTNQWKTLGRFPSKLCGYAVVTSGSTMYVAGGNDEDNYFREMWRYDVHRNSWLKIAPMNEPRSEFRLVMLDGYVFAVGGEEREKYLDSMERYDPNTDTWQLMKDVGLETHSHYDCGCNVVALDGELYFIGGAPNGWIDEWMDGWEPYPPEMAMKAVKYNPKTSVWTEVAPMQIPREKSAACVLNGKIYVTGGLHFEDNRTIENTMECYNPTTNQWNMCAPMQVERCSHSVAVVDGKIYVLGGLRDGDVIRVHNIECYCEETDTWETVGQMAGASYCSDGLRCVSVRLRRGHVQPIDDEDVDSEDD